MGNFNFFLLTSTFYPVETNYIFFEIVTIMVTVIIWLFSNQCSSISVVMRFRTKIILGSSVYHHFSAKDFENFRQFVQWKAFADVVKCKGHTQPCVGSVPFPRMN